MMNENLNDNVNIKSIA